MQEALGWRRAPKVLGLVGVLLFVTGYASLAYLSDAGFEDRRPVALARVAFYAGLVLVLASAVLWYRQPPAPPADSDDDPEPEVD